MTDSHPVKGLRIDVYRNAAERIDCTLNGVTAAHETLTLVGVIDASGPDMPAFAPVPEWRVSAPSPDAPPVAVVVEQGWRATGDRYAFLVPVVVRPNGTVARRPGHAMHGGNFAGTGDSRFARVLRRVTGYENPGVLRVHDRFE
jgi:hypothetical protein